jgi:fructokinase
MSEQKPDIDLLAIGEVLVDFISTEPAENLREVDVFQRHLGGSPANIATNVSRLGYKSALIAKTGIGAFGQFLKGAVQRNGVNTDYLVMDHHFNTSIIFVSRTSGTPDFEPFRSADFNLTDEDISEEAIAAARIVHTSTWPLSREPSRSAVINALKQARAQGKIVSFDPNYSPVVWPNYQEAREVMREVFQYTTITKASLDDAHRYVGQGHTPEEYIKLLHELGPKTVVFTMGRQGSILSENGELLGRLPVRDIQVKDATGAGDAFWAGFLTALLDGHPLKVCLLFAREVVELKLQTVGTLPTAINRKDLYAQLPDVNTAFA